MKSDFENMKEFRCPYCSKLFFKYNLKGVMSIQIKCTRCNKFSSETIKGNFEE